MTVTECRTPRADQPRGDEAQALAVEDDVLTLRCLVTADPDSVAGATRAARDGTEAGLAWARAALSVGARAISTAGGAAATDALAERVERIGAMLNDAAAASAERVAEAVAGAAGPDGTVAACVDQAMRGLAADLGRLVAEEDGPLRAGIGRTVDAATADAARRVERALADSAQQVRQALSPTAPTSPLAALHAEVARAAAETRRDLSEQIAQVREALAASGAASALTARMSAKGQVFEDACVAALVDLAAPGDLVEGTGTAAGSTGGRRGDAVVTVGPSAAHGLDGVRIAVECKSRALSPAALDRELAAAEANRGALGSLAVVEAGMMPGAAAGGVLVLGPRRIVCEYASGGDTAMLRAALHLVRAAAVEQALADSVPDVDRAALAAAVRAGLADLEEFQKVDRALAAARRGLDELGKASDHVRARLAATLTAATRLLGPGRA